MIDLKKYRQEKGIKQSELAERLNVAQSTVSMWETGERNPDIVTLKRLAGILGCGIDDLLEPIET